MSTQQKRNSTLILASLCAAMVACTLSTNGINSGDEVDFPSGGTGVSSDPVVEASGGNESSGGSGMGGVGMASSELPGSGGTAAQVGGQSGQGGMNTPARPIDPIVIPDPSPLPPPTITAPPLPTTPPPPAPPPSLPVTQPGTGPIPPPVAAPSRATSFDFEMDTQGWQDLKNGGSKVSRSATRASSGAWSLEVILDVSKSGVKDVYVGVPRALTPALRSGQEIRYRVWVPTNNKLAGVQPFVVTTSGRWQGEWRHIDRLNKDAWNEIVVTLPADFEVDKLEWLGVQFVTGDNGWKGSVFIDSVFF